MKGRLDRFELHFRCSHLSIRRLSHQPRSCVILTFVPLVETSIFDEIDTDADAAADAEGLADMDAGRTISHDAMKAWLLSGGTQGELPPPHIGD